MEQAKSSGARSRGRDERSGREARAGSGAATPRARGRRGRGALRDELGAHVSVAGGLQRAPERATELGASVLQLFTKQPSRWAEPACPAETVQAFHAERARHDIAMAASHDSYLINLATADAVLFERSRAAFRAELERCVALGLEYLVTHPGNATDGDRERGLSLNSEAIEGALEEAGGTTMVLVETTAGSGHALGASFEELARLRLAIQADLRPRVGVCLDTCHVWAAGYDLRDDYDGVFARFADTVGLEWLRLFHLNDSVFGRGSRRDRHAGVAQGTLGEGPFRRLMTDERFRSVAKILETPKDDDAVAADRANLARLRRFRQEG